MKTTRPGIRMILPCRDRLYGARFFQSLPGQVLRRRTSKGLPRRGVGLLPRRIMSLSVHMTVKVYSPVSSRVAALGFFPARIMSLSVHMTVKVYSPVTETTVHHWLVTMNHVKGQCARCVLLRAGLHDIVECKKCASQECVTLKMNGSPVNVCLSCGERWPPSDD